MGVTFKSSGVSENVKSDQGATATTEIDTDLTQDARAVEERARANRDKLMESNPLEDKVNNTTSLFSFELFNY